MNQQSKLSICGPNDVVQVFCRGKRSFFNHSDTFRVADLLQKAKAASMHQQPAMLSEEAELLFTEGLECEVLRPDARGWQRGKIKIKLEFYPERLEPNQATVEQNGDRSDLDEIRQLIDAPSDQP